MNRKYLLTVSAAFEAEPEKRATIIGNVWAMGPEEPTEEFLRLEVQKWCFGFNRRKLVSGVMGESDVTITMVVPLELLVDKSVEGN